jgi:hypothetical protein
MPDVLAWNTAPDPRVFCCCYGLDGKSDDEIRDAVLNAKNCFMS